MLRKLILLSLLLTTVPTAVGMEGQYKEEVSETNIPSEPIILISSEGDQFQVVPQIMEFSDTIKGFFEASALLLGSGLEIETKQYKLRNFPSGSIRVLAELVNQIQQVVNEQEEVMMPLKSLIKAPSGHIIAKNLQKVVNEHLEDTSVEDLKQLLYLVDFLCMPALSNAVASVYLCEFQKEQKIFDISDLKIWLEKFGFCEQVSNLLIKHWYLQQVGIMQEWSIKDLLATTEDKPVVDSNGQLNLSSKNLTSLDGLYDIPNIECAKELLLNKNRLSVLETGTFNGRLSALTFLDLNKNRLSVLKAGAFNGLSALRGLALRDNNQLTELKAGVFDGLSALKQLHLQGNKLSTLDVGVFDGLSVLKALFLGNNKLSGLEVGIFNELSALEFLILNNNQLTEQDRQNIEDKIKQTTPNCSISFK